MRISERSAFAVIGAGKVFLIAGLCLFVYSCRNVSKSVQAEPPSEQANASQKIYGPAQKIGSLKSKSIDESSGLVASRSMPGKYWTHNDSGDGPFIYLIDEHGESFGVWRVTGAQAIDWEDISVGPGPEAGKTYLYIGDIGDNDSVRKEVVVYRVAEPTEANSSSSRSKPQVTEPAEAIRLRYPDGKHDAEALLVNPANGNIYIVTKIALGRPSVYELTSPADGKTNDLKRLGELRIPNPFGGVITGGSVSPDGKRVALCDYFQAYELELPATMAGFDDIWKQPIVSFNFGKRKQGESIAYRLDGRALLGTSEGKGAAIFQVVRSETT